MLVSGGKLSLGGGKIFSLKESLAILYMPLGVLSSLALF